MYREEVQMQAGYMNCPRTPRGTGRATWGPAGSQAVVHSQHYALYGFQWSISSCFNGWCFVVPGLLLHLQKPGGFQHRGQRAAENPARIPPNHPVKVLIRVYIVAVSHPRLLWGVVVDRQELLLQSIIDWVTNSIPFLQFWKLEVHDQGATRAGFCEACLPGL